MFSNKEQVLKFMLQGHIHLSKKDYSFFYTMEKLIKEKSFITSNQNSLFEKLLVKYQRQLKKTGHDPQTLSVLNWEVIEVKTSTEYLQAFLYIDDENNICLRSPFNNKFIKEFKRVESNSFVWDKLDKIYRAKYSTHALKIVRKAVLSNFTDIKFCPKVESLLSSVSQFSDARHWDPTLKKINENFYILGCNESLFNVLGDLELNDDPETLFLLSQFGIMIDEDVTQDDTLKKFASEYVTKIDIDTIDKFSQWLNLLKVETVITSSNVIYTKEITNELKKSLLRYSITCLPYGSYYKENRTVLLKTTSYSMETSLKGISKVVNLTNSRPIKIR